MAITLDPATEQRTQRELDRGRHGSPAEVIAQALDLLEAEQEWLKISKSALNQRLEQSMAQIDRGEGRVARPQTVLGAPSMQLHRMGGHSRSELLPPLHNPAHLLSATDGVS
jgi:Arc/MetJ-type ribon-helix-helix transcriptional regulator